MAEWYVGALVGAFAMAMLVLLSLNVVTSSKHAAARESMGQTFAQVQSRQGEFRSVSGRFATWDELAARGVQLAPQHSVAASNADASHWFLSLRDNKTGLICDRLGDVLESVTARTTPVCRESP
jgi:hypothetical protein